MHLDVTAQLVPKFAALLLVLHRFETLHRRLQMALQIREQFPCKLYNLTNRAMKEDPAALNDLMSRLDMIGLLPYQAQGKMDLWDRAVQLVDGNPELRAYLRVRMDEKELTEVPGARELLDTMTMYDWLEALEAEVQVL